MTVTYTIMMLATLLALLVCGYAIGAISAKLSKTNLLNFIPVLIAILMINIVFALVEMSRVGRI
ncbi:hypothetical protein ACNQFZ_14470 [Schinkia sp. CFF1]